MTNDKPRAAAYDPAIVAANRAAITEELHRIDNDRLRLVGSPVRHYLDPTDGRWHLGIPAGDYWVPYSTEPHRLPPAPVAGGRGRRVAPRRGVVRSVLDWLDGPFSRRQPMPRLVVILGLLGAALLVYGTYLSGR